MGELQNFLRRKVLAKPIVLAADRHHESSSNDGRSTQPVRANILAVSHEATLTGAPKIILGLVRELAKRTEFHCSSIINNHGVTKEDFQAHADVYYLDVKRAKTSYLKRMVEATVRQSSVDGAPVLGLVNSIESRFVGQALGELGVPVISLVHELPSSYCTDDFELVARTSSHVVFPAEYVKNAACNFVSFENCPHSVIPQGLIDPDFGTNWKPEAARRYVTSELGLPRDARLVIGCGTVDLRKGIDHFVNAARTFVRKYHDARDVHFVWVGDVKAMLHSPHHYVQIDVLKSDLADRVHFIGERKDVEPYFRAADALLMVSREDPFPCVVHEAMACGLPIIAFCNSGGAPEALQDGAGIVVPYGDSESIAYELHRLQTNAGFRRIVSTKAIERVTSKYDFADYAQRIHRLIEQTLGIEQTLDIEQTSGIEQASGIEQTSGIELESHTVSLPIRKAA